MNCPIAISAEGVAKVAATSILTFLSFPLGVMRTRRQAMIRQKFIHRFQTSAVAHQPNIAQLENQITDHDQKLDYSPKVSYTEVAKTIYNESGIQGFFRGYLLLGFSTAFSWYMVTSLQEACRKQWPGMNVALLGLLTGLAMQGLIQPLWTTISKVKACHSIPGLEDLDQYWPHRQMILIYERQGWKALWAGYRWGLILSFRYSQFIFYGAARDVCLKLAGELNLSAKIHPMAQPIIIVIAALFTQLISMAMVYPFLVLRTERALVATGEDPHVHEGVSRKSRCKWLFNGFKIEFCKTTINKILRYALYEVLLQALS